MGIGGRATNDGPVEDDEILARDFDTEGNKSSRCNDHKGCSPYTKLFGCAEHGGNYRAKVLKIEADPDTKAVEIGVSRDVAWFVGLDDRK